MKDLAVVAAGAFAGNWVAERFVLRDGPDDPTGFIDVTDGYMDEVARSILIAGAIWLLWQVV